MNINLPDFEVLVALYRHDPDALEDFRRHTLRKAVDYAPLEHRASLEKLLDQIDASRETATSPEDAALIAFGMMQESAVRLQDGWEQARDAVAGLQTAIIIERVRNTSVLGLASGNTE